MQYIEYKRETVHRRYQSLQEKAVGLLRLMTGGLQLDGRRLKRGTKAGPEDKG